MTDYLAQDGAATEAMPSSPEVNTLHLEALSLSLSDDALAELAEIVAAPPGPAHPEVVTGALTDQIGAGSGEAGCTVWVWLWQASSAQDATLCFALPSIPGRILYAVRLTRVGLPWVVESAVQAFWGECLQAGRGEPALRLIVRTITLRRGAAIGGATPEETTSLGRTLGAALAALSPGRPQARVETSLEPRGRERRRGGQDRTPPPSAPVEPVGLMASDEQQGIDTDTDDIIDIRQDGEGTPSAALFEWVEAQAPPPIVIPPDLSAAAETVLEGMTVTPLAYHLYWLRRAVDAQYEREVAAATAKAWRYELVGGPNGHGDEVVVKVTRQRGSSSTPDAGESLEPPGTNGATGWRVVRVEGHEVTLRPGSPDTLPLPSQGVLAPRANRRVAEVKRETIDMIAGGRNGAATLRALMADPSGARCAPLDDGSEGAIGIDAGDDPGLVGQLYPAQRQAVRQAIAMRPGNVMLIQGPPGTGKTTTIVAIVRSLVAKGARILLCSQSNLGVDNALERLHAADPALGLVRVGNPELVLPSVRPLLIEENGSGEARADRAPVVGGTCAGVALSRAGSGRTYDYVIVDEANKARMDEMMLACARGERLILVGDHNQLPPYPDEACSALLQAHPEASPLAGTISLFDWLVSMGIPSECRLLLDEQNRMAPELAAFISETFYGGRVRNGPRVQGYEPVAPAPLNHTLIFVDTADMAGRGERVGRGGSIANTLEAGLVARAVAWLDQHLVADLSVGVISGYREQVAMIRRLVARRPTKRPLHIDTVDSFEGREEDVIIASLVRSNELGRIGFLREASRLNVALSRSCRMLLIVGDSRTVTASPDPEVARRFLALLSHVRRHGIIVPASSFLQPPRPPRRAQPSMPSAARNANARPRGVPRGTNRPTGRPVQPTTTPTGNGKQAHAAPTQGLQPTAGAAARPPRPPKAQGGGQVGSPGRAGGPPRRRSAPAPIPAPV